MIVHIGFANLCMAFTTDRDDDISSQVTEVEIIRGRNGQNSAEFLSLNLGVEVFQSWNLDAVAFFPLKQCLGITMSRFSCLCFSMSWCISP